MAKLETLNITFVQRNARRRGPTSSEQFNDLTTEMAQDLANISAGWNDSLVPLLDLLPDGTVDVSVDAFANGLDGRTLYVDASATSVINSRFYNTSSGRPYTLEEQLDDVYLRISENKEDLENEISSIFITAENVSIVDSSNLYTASNLEDALTEVMNRIVTLESVGSDADLIAVHLATSFHPTAAEKLAMAGTDGTPSGANPFVTDSDSRLTDSRAPTGSASGALAGRYPSPTVTGLTAGVLSDDTAHGTRGGGTLHSNASGAAAGFMSASDKSKLDSIDLGSVADGQRLKKSGSTIIGTFPSIVQTVFEEQSVDTTGVHTSFEMLLSGDITTEDQSNVVIRGTVSCSNDTANTTNFFRLLFDNTPVKAGAVYIPVDNAPGCVALESYQASVAAGAHTVVLDWRTDSGIISVQPVSEPDSESASLFIQEVYV